MTTTVRPESRFAELLEGLTRAVGDRETIEVRAPFTGEIVATLPRGTAADVELAVGRARRAQPAWAATELRSRRRILLRYHDLVLAHQREGLDLIQLEAGKARRHAFEEIVSVAIAARHYAVHAGRYLRPQRRRGMVPGLTTVEVHRHPVGVVGVISPWNYPLTLAITDAIPALMAGNAVVVRPDPQTTLTALWAARLLYEAGLPREVLQVVAGEGPEVGPPLIERVDYLAFTGSTRTGRIVARQAAERLIGSSLELGGKNPMLVLADADLERAVDGAIRGSFSSAGQLCISMERIYVHTAIHDRFVARLAERTRTLRMGPGPDWNVEMGSLLSRRQLDTVTSHVADAVAKGAKVLAGGRPRPDLGPWFHEPTVLGGVADGMKAFAEETFGPVVSVYPFRTLDEAVRLANASRFGLNASVWTRNTRLGRQVAARLQAGTVNVNEAYTAAWGSIDAPMGGVRESGLGRRHGAEGILRYTEAQTIAVQRLHPLAAPKGMDQDRFARLVTGLLRLVRRLPGLR